MKRFGLTLIAGLSSLVLVQGAHADGMPEDQIPGVPSAQDSQSASQQLDRAASQARGSMGEVPQIQRVDPELQSAAIGHFSRARSLLIAALREFDQGAKLANPDAILNSKEWRSDLISRAEDLERVLAPQAKASRFSVRYDADRRLLADEAK